MSEPCQLRIPAHVVSRDTSGETLILDLQSGLYFGLKSSARLVWRLVADGTSVSEICDEFESRFDAPRERIQSDVRALVDELLARSLLTY